ncbi:hypothetical protein LJR296_004237 [Cupriavidus necator]|uniref:hypothetical protein n=1 Tax=Cupriavidus necator TaxID=106590 RepID=UPI003ECF3C82
MATANIVRPDLGAFSDNSVSLAEDVPVLDLNGTGEVSGVTAIAMACARYRLASPWSESLMRMQP